MTSTNSNSATGAEAYSRARQALHWLSALLILAMFPLGYTMARTDSDSLRSALYVGHFVIGLLILVLSVARIVLSRRQRVPAPPGMPRWNEILHTSVHRAALIVPLLLAVSGLATLATNELMPGLLRSGTVVPATLEDARAQTGHRLLAWTYLVLLATHVAGVVRYQLTKGDVLRRMGVKGIPSGGAAVR